MKSLVIKRSIVIAGHKTSVSLEDPFWRELKDIAERKRVTLSTMVGEIDNQRRQGNLSSAIRLFVLNQVRHQTPEYTRNGTASTASNGQVASIAPATAINGAYNHT